MPKNNITVAILKEARITIISDIRSPYGVNEDNEGQLYVSDIWNNSILVYDQNLQLIRKIGNAGNNLGQLYWPHDIEFGAHGNLWVTEFGNKRIQRISPTGNGMSILKTPKELVGPATSYFDQNYNLYVSDYGSGSILKFSPTGQYLGWIGAKTDGTLTNGWEMDGDSIRSKEPGGFDRPQAVNVDANGTIYVVGIGNNRIQRFDQDGRFTGWIGAKTDGTLTNGWEMSGYSASSHLPGGFSQPIAIDFLSNHNLAILEYGNPLIQQFSLEGKFLGWIGGTKDGRASLTWQKTGVATEGNEPGAFKLAYDMKIFGNIMYVADAGNHRIQKIEFR